MQASVFTLLLASWLQLSSQTEYLANGKDICRLFPDGTELRKPGYCDRSIRCMGGKSVDGVTCTGSTPFFSLSKAGCYKSKDSTDSYCKEGCTSKSSGYVGDSFNCANWYYCDKANALNKGACANGMWFDQTRKMCAYPKDVNCTASYELCNVTPPGINIKDETSCNQYITCKSSTPVVNTCAQGLYYDVVSGKCIKKSLVDCPRHPYPVDVCGTKKLAIRDKFVADGATCRGYFYCRDLGSGVPDTTPQWHQCPANTFFNAALELCQDKTARKCAEDRCDGRESGYELAEDAGCQTYIKCENGAEVEELKCANGTYFDVQTETCTTGEKNYFICSNSIDKYDPNNWT